MSRRSYRQLSRQPAWLLKGKDGSVVASVRAVDKLEAKRLFRKHRLKGERVVRADR